MVDTVSGVAWYKFLYLTCYVSEEKIPSMYRLLSVQLVNIRLIMSVDVPENFLPVKDHMFGAGNVLGILWGRGRVLWHLVCVVFEWILLCLDFSNIFDAVHWYIHISSSSVFSLNL